MPAYGEVDHRGGDVDRVDPLVGHRAHVAGPDLPDHPELALPGAGRYELTDPADLAVRARVRPGPTVQQEQTDTPQHQQTEGQGER